jgi:hypothetical protein
MAALTLFPLQFKRQDSVPIDIDTVFATTAERLAHLSSPRRYAGQIVADVSEDSIYILDSTRTTWIDITLPKIQNHVSSIILGKVHSKAMLRMNSSSDLTVTVNAVGSGGYDFPLGMTMVVSRTGTGTVTFVAGSGVTINTPKTLGIGQRHGKVTITKVGADEWGFH